MSRWIDADKLNIDFYDEYEAEDDEYTYRYVSEHQIDTAPSIDIVRCQDCRECVEKGVGVDCPSGYGYLYCRQRKSVVNEDDYCSWGEREGE